jgi:hypothetical protein
MRQQYHHFRESYPLSFEPSTLNLPTFTVRIACNLRGVSGTVKAGRL